MILSKKCSFSVLFFEFLDICLKTFNFGNFVSRTDDKLFLWRRKKRGMLMRKILIYDSGVGGELFADLIEERLGPGVSIKRVIDWQDADKLTRPRVSREVLESSIRPYIGKVDLIFIANYYLSITNLRYLKRKYPKQLFMGFDLPDCRGMEEKNVLILTTKQVRKTFTFFKYQRKFKGKKKILTFDKWPKRIDDGELSLREVKKMIQPAIKELKPQIIVLTDANFSDLCDGIFKISYRQARVKDSFDDAYYAICHAMKIQTETNKKKYKRVVSVSNIKSTSVG